MTRQYVTDLLMLIDLDVTVRLLMFLIGHLLRMNRWTAAEMEGGGGQEKMLE